VVFRSQANETKTAILQALEKCTSPDKGIGYNKLFDLVHRKVGGSRRTFHKYLNELVSTGAVKKEKDPRHGVGVIIYRTESATQEELLIEFAERLAAISKIPPIVKRFMDEDRASGAPDEWMKAWKLIAVSDVLGRFLASLMSNPKPGWHASARVIKDGPAEKVVVDMTSEDGMETEKLEFSFPHERLTKPRLYATIWKGHRRELPIPPELEKKFGKGSPPALGSQ